MSFSRSSTARRRSYDDVEKDALGTLVSKFEKVSDHTKLLRELRDLTKHRNGVAHRGFMLTAEEQQDAGTLRRLTKEIDLIKKRTQPCVIALFEAIARLNGQPAVSVSASALATHAPPHVLSDSGSSPPAARVRPPRGFAP